MKRRQILRIVPLSLSLWASAAHAQNRQNDVARLFDMAAAKHEREIIDLWTERASLRRFIQLPNISSRSIAEILAVSAEESRGHRRPSSEEITYPYGTSVLFYSYYEESLQIWLVNDLGIGAYHKYDISKQKISEAITGLRDSLNVDSLQQSRVPHQRASAKAVPIATYTEESRDLAITDLTKILLPPLIANALSAVKHLIIVPVLEIGIVPYAILKPFGDDSLLIDRMSVSIAPSLFDLVQVLYRKDLKRLFVSPLIVGNPYLPESANWSVPPLPGAEQEARSVAKMMNTTPLLGKEATKAEIVSRAEESSLLYFATHGIASSLNPLSDSFLMLSAESFEQGWWTAKEIQSIRLSAEIAVLSACQTGLGQSHDAGIIGLSRAFQLAGVPRVVMSLWSVDDHATNKLMQAFVKHLEIQIPSEALRQAMLEVRKDYSDPGKWASFVLFGTPR